MKRMTAAVALWTLAAAPIAVAGPIPAFNGVKAADYLKVARQTFDDRLVDYPSSRFRKVHAVLIDGGRGKSDFAFCGEHNSKNGVGAYLGWRPFMVRPNMTDPKRSLLLAGDEVSAPVIQQFCGSPQDLDDRDYSQAMTFAP